MVSMVRYFYCFQHFREQLNLNVSQRASKQKASYLLLAITTLLFFTSSCSWIISIVRAHLGTGLNLDNLLWIVDPALAEKRSSARVTITAIFDTGQARLYLFSVKPACPRLLCISV